MQENRKNYLILTVVLAVVFGLLSGVVSNLIFNSYFQDYSSMSLREVDLASGYYKGSNLIIREPKKVVVEQNDKIREVITSSQDSLVGIFKKPAKADKNGLENFYVRGQEAGQGLIITSDGWIMTNLKMDDMNNYAIATSDKKVYNIDKVIADKLSPFYFLHIAGKDLPVKGFAGQEDYKNGQSVLAVNWGGDAIVTSVNENKTSSLVRSSDTYNNELVLAENPASSFAIFNLNGDIIGFVGSDNKIRPINQFAAVIRSVLKNKAITRPSLGANYLDLADLIPVNAKTTNQKGALLNKTEAAPAVLPGSSADQAGLKEGDIILAINGIEINEDNNLTDVIQALDPGTFITVSYSRGGEKKDIQIKLGELK